jgi:hypothetical protein
MNFTDRYTYGTRFSPAFFSNPALGWLVQPDGVDLHHKIIVGADADGISQLILSFC